MKVICIGTANIEKSPQTDTPPKMPTILEGTICTVIDESEYLGVHFYKFAEYVETGYNWWYDASLFIPLSDIDETTIVRNKILINNA